MDPQVQHPSLTYKDTGGVNVSRLGRAWWGSKETGEVSEHHRGEAGKGASSQAEARGPRRWGGQNVDRVIHKESHKQGLAPRGAS